jgi:hypothetical protein
MGIALVRKRYKQWSETWDHDHCAFCWATFSLKELDGLTQGYATTAEYEHGAEYTWICETCFA